jgi:hypothetical protein
MLGCFPSNSFAAQEVPSSPEVEAGENTSENEKTSWDVLERKKWYPHFYLGMTEVFTDNVFNEKDDRQSDLISIPTLGAWISLPETDQRYLQIETSNISPGGLRLSRQSPEATTRYRAFLHYRADLFYHSRFSSEDAVSQTAEGMMQYNFANKVTLEVVDKLEDSFDPRGTSESDELDEFTSNHFGAILFFHFSDRTSLRADYTNFHLNYDSANNDFRNRIDNVFSSHLSYRFKPLTSLFIQYEYMDIDFDEGNDSREHHYFGGLKWKITGKSEGSVKGGYGKKDFRDPNEDDSEDFLFETSLSHRFDERKSLLLDASIKTNESNISSAGFIFSKNISSRYRHLFTGKLEGGLKLSYSDDRYRNAVTEEREDDVYAAKVELSYEFNRWVKASLAYVYTRRASNFPDFDFTSNVVFLSLLASL